MYFQYDRSIWTEIAASHVTAWYHLANLPHTTENIFFIRTAMQDNFKTPAMLTHAR